MNKSIWTQIIIPRKQFDSIKNLKRSTLELFYLVALWNLKDGWKSNE